MKVFWLQVSALLLVSFSGLLLATHSDLFNKIVPNNSSDSSKLKPLQILGQATLTELEEKVKANLSVEIADTKEKRSLGLGGRTSLASDSGMLFIFDMADKHQFWMKGLKFPLDFIWIKGNVIVDILANVPVPQPNQKDSTLPIYTSKEDTDKVLEVNAGFAANNNIVVGDKIKL